MPDVFRRYEFKHILGRGIELPELVPEVVGVWRDVILRQGYEYIG